MHRSSYYETAPVEFTEQPPFINNVLEVDTDLEIHSLWQELQRIQNLIGVPKQVPKGPRLIDMDILLYGDEIVRDDQLTIPHESMCIRRFVLVPLLEIAPELKNPVDGRPFRVYLEGLDIELQRVEIYRE